MALYRTSGANPTGDAVEANVLSGKTFSNNSGTDKVGTMPNNGAVSPSALSPNGSYTIPEGYHNGNGVVTASPNTGTYSPTTRNAALDMGISNLNRYVNTNGVPNSNSGTYTFPANNTGGTKDLGETNTYRYVNATNVYNKGKADGSGSLTPVAYLTASNRVVTLPTNKTNMILVISASSSNTSTGATYCTISSSSGCNYSLLGKNEVANYQSVYSVTKTGSAPTITLQGSGTYAPSVVVFGV